MGNSFDRIDEGLYICGARALKDIHRLQTIGVKRILNVATLDLYNKSSGEDLHQLLELFDVRILGCLDSEDCNISIHFEDIANFVEEGRLMGGVVVHCAAGISRSSTSCIAYLMIKEHLSLEAAFLKVFAARPAVEPNPGFWRQLRDLENVLSGKGIALQPPDYFLQHALEMAETRSSYDPRNVLQRLDEDASRMRPFVTHVLNAHLMPKVGVELSNLEEKLRLSPPAGIIFDCIATEVTRGDDGTLAGFYEAHTELPSSDLKLVLQALEAISYTEADEPGPTGLFSIVKLDIDTLREDDFIEEVERNVEDCHIKEAFKRFVHQVLFDAARPLGSLNVRFRCVPAMNGMALRTALEAMPDISQAVVEVGKGQAPRENSSDQRSDSITLQ